MEKSDYITLTESAINRLLEPVSVSPFVFLESSACNRTEKDSYLFSGFEEIIEFTCNDDPAELFARINIYNGKGFWVCGYFTYEFGYFLDPKLHPFIRKSDRPYAWLGICKKPVRIPHEQPLPAGTEIGRTIADTLQRQYRVENVQYCTTRDKYHAGIAKIKQYLEQGMTYQVNYTFKSRFDFSGDVTQLYLDLRRAQPTSYTALINTGTRNIISLSPELFFRVQGRRITTRPMKGTISRGYNERDDRDKLKQLQTCPKTRAENLMIVDLLRNDLGRIAENIQVPHLFSIEKYRTLFQMTSVIEGTLGEKTSAEDIFRALFPCGSITGAPKLKTMEIIHELESEPRDIYTGSIGFFSPDRKMCFNVAIRTLSIENGRGELGIGGGVLVDSDADGEYDEALLKAAFFSESHQPPEYIESILWERNKGYYLLDLHMNRLQRTCAFFTVPLSIDTVSATLLEAEGHMIGNKYKVRIKVGQKGNVQIDKQEIQDYTQPVSVKISTYRTDPDNAYLYHKTTHRSVYDREREEAVRSGYVDVLFCNKQGELTEGAISNLFLMKDGFLFTPPVCCGLLPGVLREHLIDTGQAREEVLRIDDLKLADKLYIGNSVRGLMEAHIHWE